MSVLPTVCGSNACIKCSVLGFADNRIELTVRIGSSTAAFVPESEFPSSGRYGRPVYRSDHTVDIEQAPINEPRPTRADENRSGE